MIVIAERSVRSEQAVRLLRVSRNPGRHALSVGVGVSVAEVRGSLFGYPPKKLHGFGKRALDVCLIVVSECLMEFAEDTGVGPRLQETPLVPGVVTGTVSGARVPRQHLQKLLFHIVVGTGFRYPEFAAPELLCGPHCMVEEIAAQRKKLI
jgi:hypothetical protein